MLINILSHQNCENSHAMPLTPCSNLHTTVRSRVHAIFRNQPLNVERATLRPLGGNFTILASPQHLSYRFINTTRQALLACQIVDLHVVDEASIDLVKE